MYIALDVNKNRIRPTKEIRSGVCQCCNEMVIAKTGDKNVWHWAHAVNSDCPQKGKGAWHYWWQEQLAINEVEVRDLKWPNNIADICIVDDRLPFGGYLVVELQESPISRDTVKERNGAYKNIMWVSNLIAKPNVQKALSHADILLCTHDEIDKFTSDGITYAIKDMDVREFLIQVYLTKIKAMKDSIGGRYDEQVQQLKDDLVNIEHEMVIVDEELAELKSGLNNIASAHTTVANAFATQQETRKERYLASKNDFTIPSKTRLHNLITFVNPYVSIDPISNKIIPNTQLKVLVKHHGNSLISEYKTLEEKQQVLDILADRYDFKMKRIPMILEDKETAMKRIGNVPIEQHITPMLQGMVVL
jgi:competence CoiA-like predicted nuclease